MVSEIIFLMCCGDNKGLEPYKYKERYLMALCLVDCGNRHGTKHGSAMKNNAGFKSRKEPPAKAVLKMRMESPNLLEN